MFGMLGVFAEFERAVIRERILAGMARARDEGKPVGAGKPPLSAEKIESVRALIAEGGHSLRYIAKASGVSLGMAHKIKSEAWMQ